MSFITNHRRRSMRLRLCDYTQAGVYFLTVCTHNRECLFGEIAVGQMVLNDIGRLVAKEWERTAEIRQEVELDAWVVMPNHLHLVVLILPPDDENAIGRGVRPYAPTTPDTGDVPVRPFHSIPRSLSSLMQGFKSATTKGINELRGMPRVPVWQRNYYEHVIRTDADLTRIREYIENNPQQWDEDDNNPTNRTQ